MGRLAVATRSGGASTALLRQRLRRGGLFDEKDSSSCAQHSGGSASSLRARRCGTRFLTHDVSRRLKDLNWALVPARAFSPTLAVSLRGETNGWWDCALAEGRNTRFVSSAWHPDGLVTSQRSACSACSAVRMLWKRDSWESWVVLVSACGVCWEGRRSLSWRAGRKQGKRRVNRKCWLCYVSSPSGYPVDWCFGSLAGARLVSVGPGLSHVRVFCC